MNILKSFFAGLLIAAAAPVLDATVINFDELNISDAPIPNGYADQPPQHWTWTNFYVYNATDNPEGLTSGYQYSVASQKNVAFNGGGSAITLSSNTPFTFNSAYLTSVWRDNLQVEVIGSLGGVPVPTYDHTFTLSATANTLETFNYVGVDSVVFIPTGGTFHDGYTNDYGTYFAMDNLNVDLVTAVPEPGTWFAGALALAAIAFSQRRRLLPVVKRARS